MTVNQICSKNNTKDTTGGAGTLIVWGFIFYVCCLYLFMPISIQWYLYITWRSCKLRFYFSGIGDFSRLSLILYRFFGFIAPENIKLVGFPFFSEAEEGFYRNSSSALNLTSTILLLIAITVCPTVLSPFMTCHWKFKMSNTIGATSGAGTATITVNVG